MEKIRNCFTIHSPFLPPQTSQMRRYPQVPVPVPVPLNSQHAMTGSGMSCYAKTRPAPGFREDGGLSQNPDASSMDFLLPGSTRNEKRKITLIVGHAGWWLYNNRGEYFREILNPGQHPPGHRDEKKPEHSLHLLVPTEHKERKTAL